MRIKIFNCGKRVEAGRPALALAGALLLWVFPLAAPAAAQNRFRILVDVNQMNASEVPQVAPLAVDGVWAITQNNCGLNCPPLTPGYSQNSPDILAIPLPGPWPGVMYALNANNWTVTEDESLYGQETLKNNNLLTIQSYLSYMPVSGATVKDKLAYEENFPLPDGGPVGPTVSSARIDSYVPLFGNNILVESREYLGDESDMTQNRYWTNQALLNPNTSGVVFEINPEMISQDLWGVHEGLRHCLDIGKRCYLLLPPNQTGKNNANESPTYATDIIDVMEFLQLKEVPLNNPNLFIVPAIYNRPVSDVGFITGDEGTGTGSPNNNSILGAVTALQDFRNTVAPQTTMGWADSINSTSGLILGWALDPQAYAASAEPINVEFYADGPRGTGTLAGTVTANIARADINAATGFLGNHAYQFSIPAQYRDGQPHTWYVYGNSVSGNVALSRELDGSPKSATISVAPPAIAWTASSGAGAYDIGSPVNPASVASGQAYGIRAQGTDTSGLMNTVNINKNGAPFAYVGGGDGFIFIANNPTSDTGPATITYTAWATDSFGTSSEIITKTVTVAAGADTTAPVISAVGSSNISDTAAAIAWTTNEASDSQVEYGLNTSYGTLTALNASMVTSHSAGISGLSASTAYHYRVISRDAANNPATSADYTFSTSAAPDTTAPVISAVGSSNVSDTAAAISWTTDEASDSQVEYGLTTAYGTETALNASMVTSHSAGISGLSASSTYHYKVKSRDAANNPATSADYTFTTSAAPPASPALQVDPASLNYAAIQNGVNPPAQDLDICNTVPGTYLAWTVTTDSPWLSAARDLPGQTTSGTEYSLSGSACASPRISVTAAVGSLAAGTHNGNVTVNSDGGNASVTVIFTVSSPSDITAPVISGVDSSNISNAAATISWTTDEVSDSQVEYGLNTSYGNSTALNTSMVTSHSAGLSGLSASSTYHYRVRSRDAANNPAASADQTFSTSAAPDTTAPVLSSIGSSNVTYNSASISWTTDEASDSQVEYGLSAGYGTSTTLNTSMLTGHSAGLSGLSASSTYHYRVKSRDAANNPATSADYTFSTSAAPDTTAPVISGVGSSNISNSAATISWATNEGSDSQVEYGLTTAYGSFTTLNTNMVTSHGAGLSGLSASTLYHYRVRSKDAAANPGVSGDYTFTTSAAPDATAPVISGAGSSGITDTAATISWTTDEASDSQVEYGLSAAYTNFTTLNAAMLTSHSAGITGLTGSTTYHYRVRSRDASSNLGISADYTFTTSATPDTAAPVITGVGSSQITYYSAAITWTTNETSDSQVEYGTSLSYGNSTALNAAMLTSHSAGLSGLAAGTLYYYRVKSKDAAANLAASGNYTFTTSAAPDTTAPVISGVGISNITNAAATIFWTTNEASSSQVEYGPSTSYGNSTTLNSAMVTSHNAGLSGLTGSTLYHYRVRSKDAALNTGTSNDLTFTTSVAPDTTPPVFTGVGSSQISYNSAAITWTTDEASSSQVEYGLTTAYGTLTALNANLATSHSAGLSGLTASTLYHYRVRSRDAAANTGASGDYTFTTHTIPTNTPPSIGVDSPPSGATLPGTVEVAASAWDDAGVAKVEFTMCGITYTDTTAPYSHQLNTLKFTNGWQQLTVKAYDINANTAETVLDLRIQNPERTEGIVTSTGGTILSSLADILVPPMSLAAPVTIAVVPEAMDDDALLDERSANASLQDISPIASGFRLLPDGYLPAGQVNIKLPLNRSVKVSATMEETVGLYSWNDTANAWQLLTSTYNATDDTMNSQTSAFSVYRLFSRIPLVRTPAVGDIYVFPNPAKNGAKPVFHIQTDSADKVEIRIHDFTGRQIHTKTIAAAPTLYNRNNKLTYAYEYEWDAKNAASGAYFYIVIVSKSGGKTLRKGKFALIR